MSFLLFPFICTCINGCNRPNGVTFNAGPGTSEFTKRFQPKEGDIVSFKHRGFLLGSKKPKNPVLYRLRSDIQWDDVVQNFKDNTSKATGNNPIPPSFYKYFLFNIYLSQHHLCGGRMVQLNRRAIGSTTRTKKNYLSTSPLQWDSILSWLTIGGASLIGKSKRMCVSILTLHKRANVFMEYIFFLGRTWDSSKIQRTQRLAASYIPASEVRF